MSNNATSIHATPNDRRERDTVNMAYRRLLEDIRTSFEYSLESSDNLFVTRNNGELYNIFLRMLPPYARKEFDCRTCRNFVNKYGGLVTINYNGELTPVLWDIAAIGIFKDAVTAIREYVKSRNVVGVFYSEEVRLGVASSGGFNHMSVDIPLKSAVITMNAEKKMAEKKEEYKMLSNALDRYLPPDIAKAEAYLSDVNFYRGDKFKPMAEWFYKIAVDKLHMNSFRFSKYLWMVVAEAPVGYCHIANTVLGTMLEDIHDGLNEETIKTKFNMKMDPTRYMRPQANPSIGNVKRAEEIMKKLGIENSLKRRFATLEDLDPIWKPKKISFGSGVFDKIPVKDPIKKSFNPYTDAINGGMMTWEKFSRTVLPGASRIQLMISGMVKHNFTALITAVDPEAPPILKWDFEVGGKRCPLSWYLYSGGSWTRDWNLGECTHLVTVNAIDALPTTRRGMHDQFGKGVIFILDNCKDLRYENAGNALFPEILRSELYEVRSTIEAYSKNTRLEGFDKASACGVSYSSYSQDWGCNVKVTHADGRVVRYTIDRWD